VKLLFLIFHDATVRSEYVHVCLSFVHILLFEIQLSRGEGWDPIIKRGGLGSKYQEGSRVEIQLSRGEQG
jgi:hypothetical protein